MKDGWFWSRVDQTGGADACWPWRGGKTEKGYGRIKVAGLDERAHRVAYRLAKGDPGHRMVCHRCDNPACCNPAHLWLGDVVSNNRDKTSKGRGVVPWKPCHLNGRAVLTPAKVKRIREQMKTSTNLDLGRAYRVHHSTISKIRRGITWQLLS